MKMFIAFTVYTCLWFFDCISDMLSLDNFRFNYSTVLIHDYVVSEKDPLHSFLIEAFSNKSAILFTSEEHLLNVVMFDTYYCPHYDKDTYFTARLSDHWFHSIKKCYKCYRLCLKKLLKFYPAFYVKNEDNFKKFSTFAKASTRVIPDSAGFDLYSSNNIHCHPKSWTIMQTDIGFEIPPGYF